MLANLLVLEKKILEPSKLNAELVHIFPQPGLPWGSYFSEEKSYRVARACAGEPVPPDEKNCDYPKIARKELRLLWKNGFAAAEKGV